MHVSLTPELEQLVHRKVEAGQYGSPNDVILEALRLMEERDRADEQLKTGLREKIAAGVASLRAGRTLDGDAVFDRLEAELGAEELRELRPSG